MANNNINDFIKISNEYVKFYASKNTMLPSLLKNTGAISVIQTAKANESGNDFLRELYLAYNFIASGHGFIDNNVRDYFSYWGLPVNEATITSELTGEPRILDSMFKNISVEQTNIRKAMSAYVETIGGHIDNTFISTPPGNATTEMHAYILPTLFKTAKYEPITITSVNSYINYEYPYLETNGSQSSVKIAVHSSYVTNADELIGKDKEVSYMKFDVPRGVKLHYAYNDFSVHHGDTNGFEQHNENDDSRKISHYNLQVNDTHKYTQEMSLSAGETVTTNNFVSKLYFTATTEGTPTNRYKVYPLSKLTLNSIENKIEPYTKKTYFMFNIYDVIKYRTKNYTNSSDTLTSSVVPQDIYMSNKSKMSRIYDNDKHEMSYAIIDLSNTNENSYIYFSVPINYDVTHVYATKKYIRNNRTSFYESNITGDAFELSHSTENKKETTMYSPIVFNGTSTIDYECRNYVLNNNCKNSFIKILLQKIDKNPTVSNKEIDYTNKNNSVVPTKYFIQDGEYNATHWLNENDLPYVKEIL